jgi:hypothetical protein
VTVMMVLNAWRIVGCIGGERRNDATVRGRLAFKEEGFE